MIGWSRVITPTADTPIPSAMYPNWIMVSSGKAWTGKPNFSKRQIQGKVTEILNKTTNLIIRFSPQATRGHQCLTSYNRLKTRLIAKSSYVNFWILSNSLNVIFSNNFDRQVVFMTSDRREPPLFFHVKCTFVTSNYQNGNSPSHLLTDTLSGVPLRYLRKDVRGP